jgi:hypothetical protein
MEQSTMFKSVTEAIRSGQTADNKYVNAGAQVKEFYGTETSLIETKADFVAHAIIPALDKKHQVALAKELPRKGSADYVAFVGAHGVQLWEDVNQAKKDARATAHTYFARVVSYAFPKDKKESAPRDLQTRIIEEIAALIKACQKAEAVSFDVQRTITALDSVLSAVVPKQ